MLINHSLLQQNDDREREKADIAVINSLEVMCFQKQIIFLPQFNLLIHLNQIGIKFVTGKMYVKICNRKLSYGNICMAIAIYSVLSLLGHFYWKVENMLLDLSCAGNIYTFLCIDDLFGFIVFSTGLLMAIFLGIASTTVIQEDDYQGSISLYETN